MHSLSYKIKKVHLKEPQKAFLFLMRNFNITMRESQRWIDKKRLLMNGEPIIHKSFAIHGEIEVIYFEPTTLGLKPIFQTDQFALFDKPSGVLVHPKNRHTDYSIIHEAKYLFGKSANIVHRIDKETSGLIIVAKTRKDEIAFKKLFEARKIQKGYIALVRGKIDQEIFIDAPIAKNRDYSEIKLKTKISEEGKPSQTIIKPIRYFTDLNQTLVEAIPLTGRQHQIRVHLYHVGHPIVGDPIYGVDYESADAYLNGTLSEDERLLKTGGKRLMLHANWLSFNHHNRYRLYSKSDIYQLFNLCQ